MAAALGSIRLPFEPIVAEGRSVGVLEQPVPISIEVAVDGTDVVVAVSISTVDVAVKRAEVVVAVVVATVQVAVEGADIAIAVMRS